MPKEKFEFTSFERLDELMKVTDPKGWGALFGAFFLVACIIVWVFIGRIPSNVLGTGMLISVSGLDAITANASGKVIKFDIKVGDTIKEGQAIAYIEQIALANDIANLKQKIQEKIIENQEKESIRLDLEARYKEELLALNTKLKAQEKLLRSGLVLERDALDTKQKITETEKDIENFKIERLNDKYALNSLNRELSTMQNKYDRDSVITSPFTGRVIETIEAIGDVVSPGKTIATIETMGNNQSNNLEAVIYVPALEAKKVLPGMRVLVSPTTIKAEEYGSIVGKVRSISTYPATLKGVLNILHNEEIAKRILEKENQVELYVDLMRDPNTYSGFKWTSLEGAPTKIQSGTLCTAKIKVEEKRPIMLIIPKLKKLIGAE